MIDNFDKIKTLLEFKSEDDFYHLQILRRKKENPDLGSNSEVVKTYYISSLEYLERKKEEIKQLCFVTNARAYINLNKRSYYKTGFSLLEKVSQQMMNKDFKSIRKAYESVCGNQPPEGKWIIDIDTKNENFVRIVINDITNCSPNKRENKVIEVLETLNGYHVISNPFNVQEFKLIHSNIDIQKNNPTILYIA